MFCCHTTTTTTTTTRYSTEEHEQKFFTDHTDSVVSLAMHPILDIAATGSNGPAPEIIVWNTITLQTLAVLRGFHVRAVTHLAFSPDGEHLLSVGGDDNHSVAVYVSRAPARPCIIVACVSVRVARRSSASTISRGV